MVDLAGIDTKSMRLRCDNQGPVILQIKLLPTSGTSTGKNDHLHGIIHGYVCTKLLEEHHRRTLAAYDTFEGISGGVLHHQLISD
jgi:hypothetical protein